jgi:hypothetical protein
MAEEVLVGLRDFLEPYLPFLNSHNVDYLTRDHWNTYVPEWIRREERINLYDLLEQRYRESTLAKNLLEEFIDQIVEWKKRIEKVTYTHEQFEQVLQEQNKVESKLYKHTNRTFMSQKKEHEVEILSPVINQIANMAKADSVDFQYSFVLCDIFNI